MALLDNTNLRTYDRKIIDSMKLIFLQGGGQIRYRMYVRTYGLEFYALLWLLLDLPFTLRFRF